MYIQLWPDAGEWWLREDFLREEGARLRGGGRDQQPGHGMVRSNSGVVPLKIFLSKILFCQIQVFS